MTRPQPGRLPDRRTKQSPEIAGVNSLPPLCMITISPDIAAAARACLARHGAQDLAGMLGIEDA